MASVEHKRSRVACKKMKIDKMATARILSKNRTSAEIALIRNLRANILFAGTERVRHRETRHDVDSGRRRAGKIDRSWQGLFLVDLMKRCFDLRVVYSSLHRSFPVGVSTISSPTNPTSDIAYKQSLVSSIIRYSCNQHSPDAPQGVGCPAALGILSDYCRKPSKIRQRQKKL
jgi:hypothetical protein